MDKQTPPLADEINALKETYAALNRNDIPAFLAIFDPQIERMEPADFPGGGIYQGIAAVTEHVYKARSAWAEGSCEPERFRVIGDRVIVWVAVHVRLKHEAEWREGRVVDVYTFRNGKAVQFRTFTDEGQAAEWVGGKV